MMDKKVVMCDFNGIKVGMLVRVHDDWHDLSITGGMIGIVIDRITYAHMLGDGDNEKYDPMLIVVGPKGRQVVPVDAVSIVDDE